MTDNMELALQAINDLEREGLIQRHAIGGAMGATFYLEPVSTFHFESRHLNRPPARRNHLAV